MKPILLFLLIITTLMQNLNASSMRGTSTSDNEPKHIKNIQKHIVKCHTTNHYTFIFSTGKSFYSDRYKIFKTQKEAINDSCTKKITRAKNNAIMCKTQKEMRSLITEHLVSSEPIYSNKYKNCVRLLTDINIKTVHHYYIDNYKSYYAIVYNNEIYYIQTKDLSVSKFKNIYKKRLRKLKRKKVKYLKKKVSKKTKKKKRKYNKKAKHNTMKHKRRINKNKVPQQKNSTKRTKKIFIKQGTYDYTYRCVATYGEHTITANNKKGMSEATDMVWAKCHHLKSVNDECLIKDCYKLILN